LGRVAGVSKPSLGGVYVPIITPFSDEGAVATDALEALCRRLLDDGVAGLVPLGTAGEGALLTDDPITRLTRLRA
jgi:4-hydroxy-tetrahydrodipicolinate synthase